MNFLKYKNVNSLAILSVTDHKKQEINGSWLKVEQNIYYTKLIWMFLEYDLSSISVLQPILKSCDGQSSISSCLYLGQLIQTKWKLELLIQDLQSQSRLCSKWSITWVLNLKLETEAWNYFAWTNHVINIDGTI